MIRLPPSVEDSHHDSGNKARTGKLKTVRKTLGLFGSFSADSLDALLDVEVMLQRLKETQSLSKVCNSYLWRERSLRVMEIHLNQHKALVLELFNVKFYPRALMKWGYLVETLLQPAYIHF